MKLYAQNFLYLFFCLKDGLLDFAAWIDKFAPADPSTGSQTMRFHKVPKIESIGNFGTFKLHTVRILATCWVAFFCLVILGQEDLRSGDERSSLGAPMAVFMAR